MHAAVYIPTLLLVYNCYFEICLCWWFVKVSKYVLDRKRLFTIIHVLMRCFGQWLISFWIILLWHFICKQQVVQACVACLYSDCFVLKAGSYNPSFIFRFTQEKLLRSLRKWFRKACWPIIGFHLLLHHHVFTLRLCFPRKPILVDNAAVQFTCFSFNQPIFFDMNAVNDCTCTGSLLQW